MFIFLVTSKSSNSISLALPPFSSHITALASPTFPKPQPGLIAPCSSQRSANRRKGPSVSPLREECLLEGLDVAMPLAPGSTPSLRRTSAAAAQLRAIPARFSQRSMSVDEGVVGRSGQHSVTPGSPNLSAIGQVAASEALTPAYRRACSYHSGVAGRVLSAMCS